ncbi:hypothetical protein GCM10010442_17710 [Kitasatospora kifunensis]
MTPMTLTDEDCLAETLAFNEQFEAAAASRPPRGQAPDATVPALLRRNRLAGDTPPVRLPIAASMTGPASLATRELAARIVTLPARTAEAESVRAAVEQAVSNGMVLHLSYADAAGWESERVVEPAGLLTADGKWYLIAWCGPLRWPHSRDVSISSRRLPSGSVTYAYRMPSVTPGAGADTGAAPHSPVRRANAASRSGTWSARWVKVCTAVAAKASV